MNNFTSIFFNELLNKNEIDMQPFGTQSDMEIAYAHWVNEFSIRATTFYTRQLQRHHALILKDFISENNLDPEIPLDEYESSDTLYAFQEYAFNVGFLRHQDMQRRVVDILQWWRDYETKDYEIASPLDLPSGSMDIISAIWFERATQKKPEWIAAARKLPYKAYLQSDHWQRVRAAMLILKNARCEDTHCGGQDSGWGYEQNYHVHHLTYARLGAERFADLKLLCNQHHAQTHGR